MGEMEATLELTPISWCLRVFLSHHLGLFQKRKGERELMRRGRKMNSFCLFLLKRVLVLI